jgi:hypothetical protein
VVVSLKSKVAEPELSAQTVSSANKLSNCLLKMRSLFTFNRQSLRGTQCSNLTSTDHPEFSPNYVQNFLNLVTIGNNCYLSRECGECQAAVASTTGATASQDAELLSGP